MLYGRATGGFAPGKEPSRKRGMSGKRDVPFEVLGVAAQVRDRFESNPSALATGNLALAHLLTGDAEKGVRLAELRTLQEPTPLAFVDLSAAFLERAVEDGNADDFARSYDSALRALRLQPGLHEALFNRALALDGLGLAWIARQAWQEYLAADPTGRWSAPARGGLAAATLKEAENNLAVKDRSLILAAWGHGRMDTVTEIATRRPDLAREVLRREALPAVARAKLAAAPLEPSLTIARELNGIAEAADRDTLDREAIIGIVEGDLELAAAHVSFAQASQELDDRRIDKASPAVLHAARVFRRKGSPYAEQGELQSALVDFFSGRRDHLPARYTAMIARNRGRYPLLRARAHWMRALCRSFIDSDQWQVFLDRREAFGILTEARQVPAARQIGGQLWASLNRLGREAEAGRLWPAVTSSLSVEDIPFRTLAAIETLSEYLSARGLPLAALEVRERTTIEGEGDLRALRVNAAFDLVQLAVEVGDGEVARRALASATRSLETIDDSQLRSEMEIQLGLASLAAHPFASKKTTRADDARLISTLRERRNEINLVRALTLAGEARLADGLQDQGEPAFREALNLLLAARSRIEGEFERIRAFEGAEQTADDLIDVLSLSGRRDEALLLGESLRHPELPPLKDTEQVKDGLAKGEAVLNYWMLRNRVLVTVVTEERVEHAVLPVSRLSVKALVGRLSRSIEVDSQGLVTAALSDIHEALVAPIEPLLGSSRRLWIIPDRDLWEVPFAGLTARGHEPLASRYEIVFTSSLQEFLEKKPGWTTPDSILAVGNPSWDRSLFGDLKALPESLKEARAVAALYPRSRVLGGPEATRRAVQRLAPDAEVVHLATHAIGNDRDPGESFLLFAADGTDSGPWRARDSGWATLARARLVVLSACRTGSQRSKFGGMNLGVLRSIQGATAAQLLVSTGDVDDAASRLLLEMFHRRLRAGAVPGEALRQAQMQARKERSGITWMLYRIVV